LTLTYRMWYSGLDINFDPNLGYAWYTVLESSQSSQSSTPEPPKCSDISDYVDEDGLFTEDITAESTDGNCRVTVAEGTIGLTEEGAPLSEIGITFLAEPPRFRPNSLILLAQFTNSSLMELISTRW